MGKKADVKKDNTDKKDNKDNKAGIKYRHLKFIPTGNVFKLPEEEAVKILRSDRDNYKIVDKDYADNDTEDTAKTSTYEQVVVDNADVTEDNADENDEKTGEKEDEVKNKE